MSLDDREIDGVRVLTMNAPRLHLFTPETVAGLTEAFAANDATKPLVVTSTGDVFSAGVDVKAISAFDKAGVAEFARAITRMTATLLAIDAPVIAALPGHAIGGGLVLALCADFRVATDDDAAKFGLGEAKAGVPFPSGPAAVILAELPPNRIRRLALASINETGQTMRDIGVFDELAPRAELRDRAVTTAKTLAAQPAFAAVKRQVRGELRNALQEAAASGSEPHFGA